ncbi:MAG: hypothetical protein GX904_03785 [Acholeplasmataceae bacterium]|mgnify:CR=1 FL=1|nr:hypothetical protein [Acholeplasmataceae bacterium]
MRKLCGITLLIILLISCKQETAPFSCFDIYNAYKKYGEYCNGHMTDSDPWTLYVNPDTPGSVITPLEEKFLVEIRASQPLSVDNVHDIVMRYFVQSSEWSVIEKNDDHIKVLTGQSTLIESPFILSLIEDELLVVEYSVGELVLSGSK